MAPKKSPVVSGHGNGAQSVSINGLIASNSSRSAQRNQALTAASHSRLNGVPSDISGANVGSGDANDVTISGVSFDVQRVDALPGGSAISGGSIVGASPILVAQGEVHDEESASVILDSSPDMLTNAVYERSAIDADSYMEIMATTVHSVAFGQSEIASVAPTPSTSFKPIRRVKDVSELETVTKVDVDDDVTPRNARPQGGTVVSPPRRPVSAANSFKAMYPPEVETDDEAVERNLMASTWKSSDRPFSASSRALVTNPHMDAVDTYVHADLHADHAGAGEMSHIQSKLFKTTPQTALKRPFSPVGIRSDAHLATEAEDEAPSRAALSPHSARGVVGLDSTLLTQKFSGEPKYIPEPPTPPPPPPKTPSPPREDPWEVERRRIAAEAEKKALAFHTLGSLIQKQEAVFVQSGTVVPAAPPAAAPPAVVSPSRMPRQLPEVSVQRVVPTSETPIYSPGVTLLNLNATIPSRQTPQASPATNLSLSYQSPSRRGVEENYTLMKSNSSSPPRSVPVGQVAAAVVNARAPQLPLSPQAVLHTALPEEFASETSDAEQDEHLVAQSSEAHNNTLNMLQHEASSPVASPVGAFTTRGAAMSLVHSVGSTPLSSFVRAADNGSLRHPRSLAGAAASLPAPSTGPAGPDGGLSTFVRPGLTPTELGSPAALGTAMAGMPALSVSSRFRAPNTLSHEVPMQPHFRRAPPVTLTNSASNVNATENGLIAPPLGSQSLTGSGAPAVSNATLELDAELAALAGGGASTIQEELFRDGQQNGATADQKMLTEAHSPSGDESSLHRTAAALSSSSMMVDAQQNTSTPPPKSSPSHAKAVIEMESTPRNGVAPRELGGPVVLSPTMSPVRASATRSYALLDHEKEQLSRSGRKVVIARVSAGGTPAVIPVYTPSVAIHDPVLSTAAQSDSPLPIHSILRPSDSVSARRAGVFIETEAEDADGVEEEEVVPSRHRVTHASSTTLSWKDSPLRAPIHQQHTRSGVASSSKGPSAEVLEASKEDDLPGATQGLCYPFFSKVTQPCSAAEDEDEDDVPAMDDTHSPISHHLSAPVARPASATPSALAAALDLHVEPSNLMLSRAKDGRVFAAIINTDEVTFPSPHIPAESVYSAGKSSVFPATPSAIYPSNTAPAMTSHHMYNNYSMAAHPSIYWPAPVQPGFPVLYGMNGNATVNGQTLIYVPPQPADDAHHVNYHQAQQQQQEEEVEEVLVAATQQEDSEEVALQDHIAPQAEVPLPPQEGDAPVHVPASAVSLMTTSESINHQTTPAKEDLLASFSGGFSELAALQATELLLQQHALRAQQKLPETPQPGDLNLSLGGNLSPQQRSGTQRKVLF